MDVINTLMQYLMTISYQPVIFTVFYKAFNNLSAISLDHIHLSVSSRHTRASNKNKFMSLPVRTDAFKYSFFPIGSSPIGIPSHWLFASRSRFSPSMEVCWARHPPIIADHHDTPAVTGGLHPLLDTSPKNRRCCQSVTFLDFWISQSSVATYCRWGGHLSNTYIVNFLTNHLVKDFWKSVHICQIYCQTSNNLGLLFWNTVYWLCASQRCL